MIKKTLHTLLALAFVAFLLPGCGFSGMYGALYTDVTTPVEATSNGAGSKVGTSEVTSILGLVATGDAGINAAAKAGGITKISHVDMHTMSILGLYAKFTVYVYGE